MNFKIKDPTLRPILGPLAVIIAIVGLSLLLFNYSYPLIVQKLSSVREMSKEENTLAERASSLKIFRDGVLDDRSPLIYQVLPDRNTSALMITQIRTELAAKNLSLKSVEVAPEAEEEKVKKSDVTYKFESDNFMKPLEVSQTLRNSAPLSVLQNVTIISDSDGTITTDIKSSAFWVDLPETLPSLTDPVVKLSNEDQILFERVSNYKFPSFGSVSPVEFGSRENPFN